MIFFTEKNNMCLEGWKTSFLHKLQQECPDSIIYENNVILKRYCYDVVVFAEDTVYVYEFLHARKDGILEIKNNDIYIGGKQTKYTLDSLLTKREIMIKYAHIYNINVKMVLCFDKKIAVAPTSVDSLYGLACVGYANIAEPIEQNCCKLNENSIRLKCQLRSVGSIPFLCRLGLWIQTLAI